MEQIGTVLHASHATTQTNPEIGAFGGFLIATFAIAISLHWLYRNRDEYRCTGCGYRFNKHYSGKKCSECGSDIESVNRARGIDKLAAYKTTQGEDR